MRPHVDSRSPGRSSGQGLGWGPFPEPHSRSGPGHCEPGRALIPGIPAPPLGMVLGSGLALRPLASRRALSSHQPVLIKFLLYVGQLERAKPVSEGG